MGLHLSSTQLTSALERHGMHPSAQRTAGLFEEQKGYAEPFFTLLGAKQVTSLDASAFEGASLIHDLNQPVPASWHERFSLVYDGGTLEHVFNFPMALKSCLQMVRAGGHFMAVTPANNYMGHGFYQFSPELYARVLCEENGYALEKMIVFEFGAERWYEVVDPANAGGRVRLRNHTPTLLAVWGKRIRVQPILERAPQQSDYMADWSAWQDQGAATPRACREGVRHQKHWSRRWWRSVKQWFRPRFPAKHYKAIAL
jgi:hypothetical protein